VPEQPVRDRKTKETRARIGEVALELFVNQGYAETTIDQIAAAAGVGRRTVFRYFATKESMVFDQLVVRREVTLQRLRERPASEPALVSLHAVLREQCERGFEHKLLDQIRTVLATEPRLRREEFSTGSREFERSVVAILAEREGATQPSLELWAVMVMAFGWMRTAVQVYFMEGRRSLLRTFDEVVDTCVRAGTETLG
jgi:AcrR family transcriptional regulator